MIFIYGDSHAKFSFRGLKYNHQNCFEVSVTMHRVGRDRVIPNFSNLNHDENSILIFAFGEVDCRCHIMKQKLLGREENDIMNELVQNYFDCISNNITKFKAIIVCGIIPPTEKDDYERINGAIKHEFPFVGTDEERSHFTQKMNHLIKDHCEGRGFHYFYPYNKYIRENGCLKYELSDSCVHIGDNSMLLDELTSILETF